MAVIISPNLVLTLPDEVTRGLTLDHPIIGWQQIITVNNIFATSAYDGFPIINVANPATHLSWAGFNSTDTITIFTGTSDLIDYLAIARHNLGSTGCPITIGYYDTASPPTFHTLVSAQILADDSPALFRWTAQSLSRIDVLIGPKVDFAQIAAMYAGKLLVLPRKLYQGMVPINYGRIAKVTTGRSEAGQFLGRIITQEFVKNTVPLSLIDPAYFRQYIAEFLIDSKEFPFFFAWRPQTYPNEVGYCHMTNDPAPINEAPHGLIAMSLEMTGIV